MNRYSLSLNFTFTLKVRLFLFFSKVHTSYSYNYILSCKETYPQPQFSIVGQCFALLKQLQHGGTRIPLPKVCLDYRLNGQSFYLFVFLSCGFLFFFLVFFQQTKKYILNLKALVNLGITCLETLTHFIVCKFNEILGSTYVKLSRLGHVELCTRIPCIHGFTTKRKIEGGKTEIWEVVVKNSLWQNSQCQKDTTYNHFLTICCNHCLQANKSEYNNRAMYVKYSTTITFTCSSSQNSFLDHLQWPGINILQIGGN